MRLRQMSCAHSTLTQVDGNGQALCADCGTLVQARLTEKLLAETMRQVLEEGR